jgi:hypothetical protein
MTQPLDALITWSCAGLGMHTDRCSRPDTCPCPCHARK